MTEATATPEVLDLRASERYCQEVARREAANFYWGFIALPHDKRVAIYALYDFAREVDDEADLHGSDQVKERLDGHRHRLSACLAGHTPDPVARVLAEVIPRYQIPKRELDELILGVEMDLLNTRYRTWEELRNYCRLVASTIGRMCVRIFGFEDPSALHLADDLGIALQLTNILRDVREDAGLGRIYLPLEELERFGVEEQALLDGSPGPGWPDLVHFQVERARRYYTSGLGVTKLIPTSSAACVRTMAGIYRGILDRIERDPEAPLRSRVRLSTAAKAAVMLRSWLEAAV